MVKQNLSCVLTSLEASPMDTSASVVTARTADHNTHGIVKISTSTITYKTQTSLFLAQHQNVTKQEYVKHTPPTSRVTLRERPKLKRCVSWVVDTNRHFISYSAPYKWSHDDTWYQKQWKLSGSCEKSIFTRAIYWAALKTEQQRFWCSDMNKDTFNLSWTWICFTSL